jgi:hypothetical protein
MIRDPPSIVYYPNSFFAKSCLLNYIALIFAIAALQYKYVLNANIIKQYLFSIVFFKFV